MKIRDIVNRDIVNLSNCEQEPIHIPGSIQPHGFLLGVSVSDFTIEYCSANTKEFIELSHNEVLGKYFEQVFGEVVHRNFKAYLNQLSKGRLSPLELVVRDKSFLCTIHLSNNVFVIDAEPVVNIDALPDAYEQTQQFLHYMEQTSSLQQLCDSVARGTREITGYDRVMIYRFDENYNGEVFAESKGEEFEPFLGLFYPHTDIPTQARELYMRNIIRLISDINYTPVPIYTLDDGSNKNLDLSLSILRSTSPIHVEYLQNMGVGATLTISLIHNNRLWGLIACHHYSAKNLPHSLRVAAQLQGHFITSQIDVRQNNEEYEVARRANIALEKLLSTNFDNYNSISKIVEDENVLRLCNASGICVSVNGILYKGGKTPTDKDIELLIEKLTENFRSTGFNTSHLSNNFSETENICDTAAGIIYFSLNVINNDCVIWFRGETLTEINWGGDPNKAIIKDEKGLHPRNSFKLYKEKVKCKSKPWLQPELNAAANFSYDLQKQISLLVLTAEEEKYRMLSLELKESNSELENINWISTHDLQEPLRKIQVMASRILEEPEDGLSEETLSWISKMNNSAGRMQTLLKDILTYTRIKEPGQAFELINLDELVHSVLLEMEDLVNEKKAIINIQSLPPVFGIPFLIRQLFINLITNALKFSDPNKQQLIDIKAQKSMRQDDATDSTQYTQISVSDQGLGFDQKYADSIFRIFSRLHTAPQFEGSGVGLALCKKIMQMHHGHINAVGKAGQGAGFNLFFPLRNI